MSIAIAFPVLADLVIPPVCAVCHRRVASPDPLCRACESAMPAHDPARCARCGPLASTLAAGAEPLARICAPLLYAGPARAVLRAFKYHHHHRLGDWLAARMAACVREQLPVASIDAVTPVPMHWLKARLRGTPSTAWLAARVAAAIGRPARAVLTRRRWTPTQTRLSPAQRMANVRGAFRSAPIAGTVLLVDDVVTSGATVRACAEALARAGARSVFVVAAACTPLA